MSRVLNVSVYRLMGMEEMPGTYKIPILGAIACGAPILAQEHIDGYTGVPDFIHADFALVCKGESMMGARIYDGDLVYIRQQDTVENGEIAAVLIDGEATLKRVRFGPESISLMPENPMYKPLILWGEEMNRIRILGKAVAFTASLL
jgi:repressor LexA